MIPIKLLIANAMRFVKICMINGNGFKFQKFCRVVETANWLQNIALFLLAEFSGAKSHVNDLFHTFRCTSEWLYYLGKFEFRGPTGNQH
jgi:hypothetical protein